MKILKDLEEHQGRLLHKKHANNEKWEKQRRRMVERWLEFCGYKYNMQNIKQLRQKHYDAYMLDLSQGGMSPETMRKHATTIKEFIEAAHLPITVNPGKAKKRKIEKREQIIRRILEDHGQNLSDEQQDLICTRIAEVL